MSEAPRYRQSLGWLAAEFVVIVLGVLTAFAAEQWRQNRQDEQAEIGYLERLKANLETDTATFQGAIDRNDGVNRALQSFLDVVDGRATFPADHIEFVEGLNGGLSAFFNRPRRDTYDELLNQGDLGRLRGSQVRDGLANYYGAIGAYLEVQVVEWEETARLVELLLIERLPANTYRWIQGAANVTGIADRSLNDFEPTPSEATALLSLVRADAEIRNLLFRQGQIQSRMSSVHGNWKGSATALLETMDAELDRLGGM